MEVLSNRELNEVVGGKSLLYLITGVGVFFIGIFNGLMSNKPVCKGGK